MAGNDILHLFVYGSLRSGFRSPAYEYISRHFQKIGDARVRGKLFDLGNYPAAVPFAGDSFIIGELYAGKSDSEFHWAIGQLDDYEGISVEEGDKPLYRREIADIVVGDSKFPAWIYWYSGDVSGKPEISSGDMMDYLHKK